MLHSTYSRNVDLSQNLTKKLTDAEIKLLTLIQSKGRFDQLMEVLPEDWEEKFMVRFYDDPTIVNHLFCNEKRYKNSKNIFERTVLSVIINKQLKVDPETGESRLKYPATPSNYDEYYKRDYDYPPEANQWKFNQDLTEHTHGFFHVDHKLIWTMKERQIPMDSDENIDDISYNYSINIYVPTIETLINVENMKANGIE